MEVLTSSQFLENKQGGKMNKFAILITTLFLSILIPMNVSGDEEFIVNTPEYLVGDFFQYSGYTNTIVNEYKNTLQNEGNNAEVTILEHEELLVNIASFEECELKNYSGFCQRGKTSHFVNLSLEWEHNTTNYFDDQMYVLIRTNEESLTPQSESPWSWTKRVVLITSIFKTNNNDEHNVERRTTHEYTTHTSGKAPEIFSVGDTWISLENRELRSEYSQRENNGLWDKIITNENRTITRLFTATSFDLLNLEESIIPVISVIEGDKEDGNYTATYIDELGFVRKIENFVNNEISFSTDLEEYRYLRTPDPSAKQTVQMGSTCFGAFMASSLIFVTIVFANEYRKQKIQKIELGEYNELEVRLKELKDKKKTPNNKENKLKNKLRTFYLEHNPAKLEHLNEIIIKMETNSFGDTEEHIELLNMQLISRYGVDLDGNKSDESDESDLEIPESSKKFKEFMKSLLDD